MNKTAKPEKTEKKAAPLPEKKKFVIDVNGKKTKQTSENKPAKEVIKVSSEVEIVKTNEPEAETKKKMPGVSEKSKVIKKLAPSKKETSKKEVQSNK